MPAPAPPPVTTRNAVVFLAVIAGGAALYWMQDILTPLALALFLAVMIDSFARVLMLRAPGFPKRLALPAAVALAVLSIPLVTSLFHYGAFTDHDVLMTRQALVAYSVGLLGLIMVKVLAPGFYSRQNVKTPVKIAVFTLLATQVMNVAFVFGRARRNRDRNGERSRCPKLCLRWCFGEVEAELRLVGGHRLRPRCDERAVEPDQRRRAGLHHLRDARPARAGRVRQ